ncbi:DUF4118 domain-containing protein [Noviherbaspirillum malthae]|uniref:DUF4118 domain-containing protein n=1 Tax=Noviherbaspirillum malthae TaxID=1260987 RepID=UPI00188F5119|nr:DUF4118 domain-containing protein [Noviherbaspirillum malthae]
MTVDNPISADNISHPGGRIPRSAGNGYAAAVCAVLLVSVIATLLLPYLDLANIVMLFLLPVVLIAARYGKGPAVTATVLGVAAFDFVFVPPRFSFEIHDVQYLVTFSVMLVVGLLISHLTANLRYQAEQAARREEVTLKLYAFSRELSGTLETAQIIHTSLSHIESAFQVRTAILMPDQAGHLNRCLPSSVENPGSLKVDSFGTMDMHIAQWAFEHGRPAGLGTGTMSSGSVAFLPLTAPMRSRGVLAVLPQAPDWNIESEQGRLLQTCAALTAIALERQHYIEVAQSALVNIESERLRNSILSALSHDLRTPLTALVGLSESLVIAKPALPDPQHDLASALHDEARRMSKMVANLLDMARIQSGKVQLDLQWQFMEEVIGSTLRACKPALSLHAVQIRLAPDLPPVRFDAVLIERVLCNLIENAAKYTPPDSIITISASADKGVLNIEVRDNGPGIPRGQEEPLFEKFVRGEKESRLAGTGLGLSICRAIVQAHGGSIRASNLPEGGVSFLFVLPLDAPPELREPEEAALDTDRQAL